MKVTASNDDVRESEQRIAGPHLGVKVRTCPAVNMIVSARIFEQATLAAAEVYLILVEDQ